MNIERLNWQKVNSLQAHYDEEKLKIKNKLAGELAASKAWVSPVDLLMLMMNPELHDFTELDAISEQMPSEPRASYVVTNEVTYGKYGLDYISGKGVTAPSKELLAGKISYNKRAASFAGRLCLLSESFEKKNRNTFTVLSEGVDHPVVAEITRDAEYMYPDNNGLVAEPINIHVVPDSLMKEHNWSGGSRKSGEAFATFVFDTFYGRRVT